MEIRKVTIMDMNIVKACAGLLVECFEHSWNTMDEAMTEMQECIENGVVIAAVEDDSVIGFAGAHMAYEPYGWELHPMAVSKKAQRKGTGSMLVKAIENEAISQGALVMFLGTDDESGATSLTEGDLFVNTFDKIRNIKNYKNHPFEFYQKNGYQIVGVLPDVNGYGKPDIHMAKRLI